MKKVINFVDKKELIIVTVLTFLIALTGLFATYAIDTSLSYNDTTEYDMSLSFDLSASTNKQVTIPAGKTKFFDIDVKNSNSGTIKYGIAYSMVTPSTLPDGVTIAKSWKSANPPSGLINANTTLPVTIAVENTSSTDITISLSIINGYEKGGDLILPTGKVLIDGEYNPVGEEEITRYYMKGYNTSFNAISYNGNECLNLAFIDEVVGCMLESGNNFLNSSINVLEVSTINVVNFDEVPSGVGSATDISRDQDNSVLLYSKASTSTGAYGQNLYDLYIATENGKVFLTSGAILFQYMVSLTSVDLADMYTDEVTDMSGMFAGCFSLTSIDASNFNTSNVTNMSGMFYGGSNMLGSSLLENLNVGNFNTSNVTNMSYMFSNLSELTSLDVSKFNTSNVTDMNYMFDNLSKLTSLDVSNFNTSKVTNMNSMFSECSLLTSLDVSNFNTSKVTNMGSMFQGLSKLTILNVSNFNTSNVTDMEQMFYNCSLFTSLDVSNFNTSKVTNMNGMFKKLTNVTILDISNFDTSKVTNMGYMFNSCTNLTTIYVSNKFDTSLVTSSYNMFTSNNKLVGGNGTAYNSSYRDKTYARIDTPSTPGYFTLKS